MQENEKRSENVDDFSLTVLATGLLHEIAHSELVALRVGSHGIVLTFATCGYLIRADHAGNAVLIEDAKKCSFDLDYHSCRRGTGVSARSTRERNDLL